MAKKKNKGMMPLIPLLVIIGVSSIVYLSFAFIHEYGHYRVFEKDGIPISGFVLLGWDKHTTSPYFTSGTAWVAPEGDYNVTPHAEWDKLWCPEILPGCNHTEIEEYYGVNE